VSGNGADSLATADGRSYRCRALERADQSRLAYVHAEVMFFDDICDAVVCAGMLVSRSLAGTHQ
jgi:hypothetical protein